MTKEQEKAYKAVESFKNFIKSKESEQNTLYENEEFYRDDIEQNELFLKMLHTVLNLIQTQQAEIEKKDKRILDLEYALLDMIMQFADRPRKSGCEYYISTMGLSALELAFNELDLDDPTPIKNVNAIYEKLQKQYSERKIKE